MLTYKQLGWTIIFVFVKKWICAESLNQFIIRTAVFGGLLN